MKKFPILLAAVCAILLSALTAQPASAATDDLIITNASGARLLNTCHSWAFNDGRKKSSNCPSSTCVLYGGQNTKSKCGWSDADGAYVPRHFRLMESKVGADRLIIACQKYSGAWFKLTPTIGITGIDHTRTFYLDQDC